MAETATKAKTDGPADQPTAGATQQPVVMEQKQDTVARRVVASVVLSVYRDVAEGQSDRDAVAAATADLQMSRLDGFTGTEVERVRSVGVK